MNKESSEILNIRKIYAILLIKHPDNTGDIHLIKAPESISENVDKMLDKYPNSKIRVFEKGYQKEYFPKNSDKMW